MTRIVVYYLYFNCKEEINSVAPDAREQLVGILSRYITQSSDLVPILREIQERFDYIPWEVMQSIARFLRLAESKIYG